MRATGLRAVHRAMAAMTLHSGTPSGARGQRCVRSAASAAAAPATENAPKPIYLKDYAKPQYAFAKVDLDFALGEASTAVKSTIRVEPQSANAGDLFLHGDESVELVQIMVDGGAFTSYKRSSKGITLSGLPQSAFELVIETRIKPQENTALEGLYKSGKNFCTQCEAEGFRRITFYQDRPDVMSIFTTKITADKAKYPVLLSNGNLIDSGDAGDGKHFTVWEDPWAKPAYLFALVAGELGMIEDKFTTMTGKNVTLRIFVEEHNLDKCEHAMTSLIKSMKWDEDVFGLEYDLELFNIVAVDDFNMGAMENKSLNIFNSRLVLATPESATDADYAAIEGVVAHEYFHNYTGNRVTCRDWFQLSLKEGLTVYRDQEFSADMNSRGVKRIGDVARLRMSQFPQDNGPMAHPIRPESYIKMDNFYTVTIYEKGAEVVRMYETLLGKDGFRKGMDLYFERHDGQAVTTEDFFNAMCDANGADLSSFKPWYSQAGTPNVTVDGSYDAAAKTFALKCSQNVPKTPGQDTKIPVMCPIAVGLVGPDGKDMELTMDAASHGTTAVLRFDQAEATYTFTGVAAKPVPSILRNFSAPVKLTTNLTEDDLVFLMANDSDAFNRWEAGQTLLRGLCLNLIKSGEPFTMPASITDAMRKILSGAKAPDADKAFIARAMMVPGEGELSEFLEQGTVDPAAVYAARKFVMTTLATELRADLEATVAANSAAKYSNEPADRAARTLKNACIGYLSYLDAPEIAAMTYERFAAADNMTDKISCLSALSGKDCPERVTALDEFYAAWKHDPLVMNKWLGIQSGSSLPNNIANVKALMKSSAFDIKNPNKVYSLIGGLCGSSVNFHAADGSGYEFLADVVIQLDDLNGQVASRMVSAFTRWKKYEPTRSAAMKAQLERILVKPGLSENVFEIVSKSLD
jgi:aminopeptidase N